MHHWAHRRGGAPSWLAGSGTLCSWPGWGSLWQRGSPGPRERDRQGWACAQGCAGYGVRGAGPGAQGALPPHSLGSHRPGLWRRGSSQRAPRGARGQRPPGGFQEGARMGPRPRARVWGCVSGPRTCSSSGGALSPGPPACCSLCSRAASSPTGLRGARPSSCSYSTHRLLSASLAAGDPAGARASPAEPMGAQEAGGRRGRGGPGPQQHAAPPSCVTRGTRTRGCPPQAGDVHIQTLGLPGGEGPRRRGHHGSTSSLTQTWGSKQGGGHRHLDSHREVGSCTDPSPAGRRAQGTASWARRTHSFLSHAEELGHVADDRPEAVVHPDVGAHPGGQLGPGVHVGKPGGCQLSARGPTPPSSGSHSLSEGPAPGWRPPG